MNGSMKTFTIILFLCFNAAAWSQTAEELELLKQHARHEERAERFAFLKESDNELQQFTSVLFLAYKAFISSQDAISCVFYPSCSEYAVQAIQQQGFIIGLMNAFDRLTRCNALSPENYPIHPGTNLFYDPVEPMEHVH